MIEQSLPVNCIIGAFAKVLAGLRADLGNLDEVALSPAALTVDFFDSLGLPSTAARQVLTDEELVNVGEKDNSGCIVLSCQWCGEEAQRLVNVRGADLLLCDACESKAQRGK